MRMVFNYEFNRVSVAVFDGDWNEMGWLWKKAEFEQEFNVAIPDVRHITIDEVTGIETVIGSIQDKEGLLRSIKAKRDAIIQAVLSRQQAQQMEQKSVEDITQSVKDLESAVVYLLKSIGAPSTADWKQRLFERAEAVEGIDGSQIK